MLCTGGVQDMLVHLVLGGFLRSGRLCSDSLMVSFGVIEWRYQHQIGESCEKNMARIESFQRDALYRGCTGIESTHMHRYQSI